MQRLPDTLLVASHYTACHGKGVSTSILPILFTPISACLAIALATADLPSFGKLRMVSLSNHPQAVFAFSFAVPSRGKKIKECDLFDAGMM